MSKESAEAALGKFAEAVNTGKFDLFDQVVASNCVDHDDLSVTPETIVQDEDTIAIAYTLTGTHTGVFGKVPPTGKKVKIRGMQISKFKDGKMVERWGSSDELGLLRQIGATRD